MKRRVTFSLGMLTFLGFFGITMLTHAWAKDKATLILDWLPNGTHVGIFAAEDRGFYGRANLQMKIPRGFGSGDTVKRLGAKGAEFGFADTPSAIVARSRGVMLKTVGVHFDKGMNAIYVLKSKGVKTPKDLEGMTFGDSAGGATNTLRPAFMQANGIKNYRLVPMSPATKHASLIAGKVDSIGTFIVNARVIRNMARKKGNGIIMFPFSKYGVDVYGSGFHVPNDLIGQKPDLIRRFLKATYGGIAWAVENPEDAVALFMKRVPTRNRKSVRFEWNVTVDTLLTDFAKKEGIGHIDNKKMTYTIDTMTRLMKLPRQVAPSEMYTNRFLPKLFPKAPK